MKNNSAPVIFLNQNFTQVIQIKFKIKFRKTINFKQSIKVNFYQFQLKIY
jgi:hypothetical protein